MYLMVIGMFMVIYAFSHAKRSTVFLGKNVKNLDQPKRHGYQKGMVKPFLSLGILFIATSLALIADLFDPLVLFIGFLVLLTLFLQHILAHHKKHIGSYVDW